LKAEESNSPLLSNLLSHSSYNCTMTILTMIPISLPVSS